MNNTKTYLRGLVIIQVAIAYEWWAAGWEKVWSPEFVNGMAKTLGYFSSHNPYGWYKDFLAAYVIPNATAFGFVIQWSEVLIAVLLIASVAYLYYSKGEKNNRIVSILASGALLGGMLMNVNYYFAAGWTSPSTSGINIVMFWVEAALLYVWLF